MKVIHFNCHIQNMKYKSKYNRDFADFSVDITNTKGEELYMCSLEYWWSHNNRYLTFACNEIIGCNIILSTYSIYDESKIFHKTSSYFLSNR